VLVRQLPWRSKQQSLSHFSLSLLREDKTKEQSNGVPENLLPQEVDRDRRAYKDRHARIIIMARRTTSN